MDAAPDPLRFVRFLTARVGAGTQARRELSYELLGARAGMRLLDVGCGVGDDVRALARLAGPTGAVIGLDASESLLAAARERSQGLEHPGTFQRGDMHHLPFDSATFDGCRAERVLIHSDDPARVVAEMARVVKRGGVVVVTEPDLDMLTFHTDNHDVARRLTRWHADSVRDGWVGRRLADLFAQCGLVEVQLIPTVAHTITLSTYPQSLVRRASERGVLTPEEAETVLGEWQRRAEEGRYLEYGIFFTATGRVR
ncbi:MAG TPA: methyltransferase domain-containing protein [Ktedonobacterales bacterium]